MLVFILNKDGNPLMPCSPAKARKLLKSKKAKVVRKTPFTLKLLHGSSGYKQEVIAGMDSGSKTIGTAIITQDQVIYQSETHLRGEEIKRKMEQRAMYRRSRRGRKTRYRKPRFLNRGASIRKDRLPPSIKHKVDAHLREKKFVESILPVTRWIVETASFDIHKIKNKTVSGIQYQQGSKLGFYNTKAYVLHRDRYTCQKCKKQNRGTKSGIKFHVHHIIFRSNGGTNTPHNLVTLCDGCHKKLHNHKNAQKESLKLQKSAQKSTKHATEVSVLKSQLHKKFGPFTETFGYITKFNRESKGLPKTHANDAIQIAGQGKDLLIDNHLFIRKLVPKGDYKQTKGAHSEMKIPTGKVYGFRKFDLIHSYAKNITGFIRGKRSTGFFTVSTILGKSLHNSLNIKKDCKKLSAQKLVLIWMEKLFKQPVFAKGLLLSSHP